MKTNGLLNTNVSVCPIVAKEGQPTLQQDPPDRHKICLFIYREKLSLVINLGDQSIQPVVETLNVTEVSMLDSSTRCFISVLAQLDSIDLHSL